MGKVESECEAGAMAIVTATQHDEAPSALHTFTVEQYMALDIPERTELLEGLIYDLSAKNAPHSNLITRLTEAIVPQLLGTLLQARFEQPIAVSGWTGSNAPEIDVAIVTRKPYARPPTAADAVAFIEVSDPAYARDRSFKISLYVRAGVPPYIVNVAMRQVEFYGSLGDLALRHGIVLGPSDRLEVAGAAIDIATLFDEPAGPSGD